MVGTNHAARRARIDALIALLARWGWLPDLGRERIACRDHRGRRSLLLVLPTRDGVVLVPSRPGPIALARLDVGRLRGALRLAVFLTSDPSAPDPGHHS